MMNLRRKLLAAAIMACMAPVGAFAQKDKDRRPPKDPGKVVSQPKDQKPPKNDNNRGDRDKGDKKGKP